MACVCHSCGMPRVRVSTTVDQELLASARQACALLSDAALLDAALLARQRAAALDASYRAYDETPLDTPDEWGDLDSFREAAGRS